MAANYVDGNAIAGILAEIFVFEPTTATTVCGGCGDETMLARSRVYINSQGAVARCSRCDDVLFTVVSTDSGYSLSFSGLGLLRLAR